MRMLVRLRHAALIAVACAGLSGCLQAGADHQLIDRFFAASRLRDRTALARLATVIFEPHTDGIVDEFTIVSDTASGPDRREVTIRARVRLAGAEARERQLVLTVSRAIGDQGHTAGNRWIITGVR